MGCINSIIARLTQTTGGLILLRDSKLTRLPFTQVAIDVARCVEFFTGLGAHTGARVGFLGCNCYEWIVADLAGIALGLIAVPFDVHERRTAAELVHSYGLHVLLTNRSDLLATQHQVRAFEQVLQPAPRDGRLPQHCYAPDDVLAFKFTSGSTEVPKALAAKAKSADDSIASVQELFRHGPSDKVLLFLPLQLIQQRYWIYSAVLYEFDVIVVSAPHALATMRAVAPTVIMGVPEFFEAVRQAFLADVAATLAGRFVFAGYGFLNWCSGGWWGRNVGLRRLKQYLGGRVRYLWTGSAATSPQTLRFFSSVGVPLLQGYGMNEVCIVAKNSLEHHRPGSVGRLLPNKEVRIAPDGEIQVRCLYEVAEGYLHCAPGDEERTFLSAGFVATGDLGYLDCDGYLYVTGRKKDLIALPSGKKINPCKIEQQVLHTGLAECCIVLDDSYGNLGLIMKPRRGIGRPQSEATLAALNERLLPEERICAVHLIGEAFSVENGLLTAQFKLKRHAIAARYRAALFPAPSHSLPT